MCTCKKVFLKIAENSLENICAGVCFLIRKKSTAKVFLLEFCEFFKSNTACIEHVQKRHPERWHKLRCKLSHDCVKYRNCT